MNNATLETALADLADSIREATLGSIETTVIAAAGYGLIRNWNDHNEEDEQIIESDELRNWFEKTKIAE